MQKEVQFRYRNGVKVVFPTLELVAWLVCYHLKEESPERPYVDITWADNGVMREYVFSLRKRPLFLITPVSGDIFESDLGVLRLIEP
ncbi:MAG: hypothetical protein MUP45_01520 [Candidatus Marinimicrobia bacterium]|nr:hypothetical protein [Candidatus Neomarinimicrobiota bacterium]